MIVLALDTTLDACSIAVMNGARPLAWASEPMSRGHQERLAPSAAAVMAQAGIGFDRLDRIAVTLGPGSFTGVRVGLAFAKGLSLALGIPCIGVGTLEALAAPSRDFVVAAIEARRGQVYLQAFLAGAPLIPPKAIAAENVAHVLATLVDDAAVSNAPMLVGSGAQRLADLWPGAVVSSRLFPDPIALAAFAATRPVPDGRPAPLYLRPPDARTLAERAARP